MQACEVSSPVGGVAPARCTPDNTRLLGSRPGPALADQGSRQGSTELSPVWPVCRTCSDVRVAGDTDLSRLKLVAGQEEAALGLITLTGALRYSKCKAGSHSRSQELPLQTVGSETHGATLLVMHVALAARSKRSSLFCREGSVTLHTVPRVH